MSKLFIGLGTALRSELFMARYSLAARALLLLPASLVIVQGLLARLAATAAEVRGGLAGGIGTDDFDAVAAASGYGYLVDGLNTGLTVLGLLLTATAAYAFAAERDSGSLRHLVIRRCSRASVVLAKLITLHFLAALAVLLLYLAAQGISRAFWEFGPVVEDNYELIGEAEIRAEIRQGLILALLPLPAAIGMGLLVSVSAQSATSAVVSALGISVALDLFKELLGDYGFYLYSSFQPSLLGGAYLDAVGRIVRGYSDVLVDEQVLMLNYQVPLPTLLLFLGLSLLIVMRRKL